MGCKSLVIVWSFGSGAVQVALFGCLLHVQFGCCCSGVLGL
jgi:hypothetical protein